MKKVSIGSWAFVFGLETPTPWGEVIMSVAESGFDGVELGGFSPHPNPDNLPTKADRDTFRQQLADLNLGCSGFAADFGGQHLLDTDNNSAYLAAFRKNLQFCADCGIPAIRVDTLQPPTIFSTVKHLIALKRLVKTWKICAAEAADKGVRMAWEFEPGFAFNKPSDIVRIVDEINNGNFGVMFDSCHSYMVACKGKDARQPGKPEILDGGVLELAKMLRGGINHIHLIDSDGTLHGGETSTHADIGEGEIDFDTLMPELAKNNVEWWTIDLCFRRDAWDVLGKNKKAVDELNRKYG